MAENKDSVIIGADTHKKEHTIALIGSMGQRIAAKPFKADSSGYEAALRWAYEYGMPLRAGIEATGSYGSGLCAYLKDHGIECFDVFAPDKKERRRRGKDDEKDAYQAAYAVLSGERCALAKEKSAELEIATLLESTYKQLVKQRTQTINALHGAIVKLPDHLRQSLSGLKTNVLVKKVAAYRTTNKDRNADKEFKKILRVYAQRIIQIDKEVKELDKDIEYYASILAPETLKLQGVGAHGAIKLLNTAGQNIDRMKNDGSFSMTCGTSPIPVSSADKCHFRLNHGGDRQANSAIHTMALTRMRYCDKTQTFIARKMSEGKSKKDAIRILKRYLSREVFYALKRDVTQFKLAAQEINC